MQVEITFATEVVKRESEIKMKRKSIFKHN